MTTNIKRSGKYRFTPNYEFAIETGNDFDSMYLYIKQDKAKEILQQTSALSNLINNHFIVKISENDLPIRINGLDLTNKYDKYVFFRKLIDERPYEKNDEGKYNLIEDTGEMNENDCLQFGECLTLANQKGDINLFNDIIKKDSTPPVLEVKSVKKSVKNKNFGEEDDMNIRLLNYINDSEKNDNAIPNNGETYAIVRKQIKDNNPFHIAFVLYSTKEINITLEASADAAPKYYPKFSFYDRDPQKSRTFHKAQVTTYTNGETIVLKNRNIDDVLKEIDEDNAKINNKYNKRSNASINTNTSINNSNKRVRSGYGGRKSLKKKSKLGHKKEKQRKQTKRIKRTENIKNKK